MRVLVNALPLRHGGGINYLQQQMRAMSRVAPRAQFHTLLSPWADVGELPGTVERVPVRSVMSRFAYEQTRLPFRRTDLLYCPANFAPLAARAPVVLTIQNANYYRAGLEQPETRSSRPPWKVAANHLSMRRADAVIAISHSLAADASDTVPGIAHKLHVIHSGAPEWPEATKPVPGLPDAYILSVASAAPHKRVDDVVAGWARSQADGSSHVALVLVGSHTEDQVARHRSMAGRHADQLVYLGWVGDRGNLKWIYERALAMVLMSTLESFSLTPIEAGSVGCPLVLSDIPAHREVAQSNAVFVAPRDPVRLADVLSVDVYNWEPGSRWWEWPVSWEDNARSVHQLFLSLATE